MNREGCCSAKEEIAEQPGKAHFIREGKIESKEKETYVDCD